MVDPGGRHEPLDDLLGPVETLRRGGVHIEGLGLLGEDLVGEVADRHPQVRVPEIDADHDAGCRR